MTRPTISCPGNAGVDGGHHTAPLVADLVQIGVADAAKQNFDLHVVFRRIAPRDRGRCKGDVALAAA